MFTISSPSLLAACGTRRRARNRRILSRKLRLESLESRLPLNAAPLPFEGDWAGFISPPAGARAVEAALAQMGSERESFAIADSLQEPLPANSPSESRNPASVATPAPPRVCWPVTRASAIERLEELVNELAQARHIPLEMLRAKLPTGPQLSDAPTENDPATGDADGQDYTNVEDASDADTAISTETSPIHSGSSDSATFGEGESSSGDGSGDGSSSGSGDGSGTSSEDGSSSGSGDGSSTSSGDGSGTSSGDGSGDQSYLLPVISAFSVVVGEADLWIASGQVVHEMPWTLTIVFGGVFEGHSTSVQTNGYFYKVFPMGEGGLVTAQAFDAAGMGSNIAFALIY